MPKETVVLLHGFASSGNSRKAQYLREKFKALPEMEFHAFDFNPTPTDFEYMTITGMINRLRQYLVDHELGSILVVGSSMGALVGVNYAHRYGGVSRMLLLAPALSYHAKERPAKVFHFGFSREIPLREGFHVDAAQYEEPVPPPAPMTIVHGRHDDVIPIAHSQRYAALYPEQVRLIEAESDHRLNDQLDKIWEHLHASLCHDAF